MALEQPQENIDISDQVFAELGEGFEDLQEIFNTQYKQKRKKAYHYREDLQDFNVRSFQWYSNRLFDQRFPHEAWNSPKRKQFQASIEQQALAFEQKINELKSQWPSFADQFQVTIENEDFDNENCTEQVIICADQLTPEKELEADTTVENRCKSLQLSSLEAWSDKDKPLCHFNSRRQHGFLATVENAFNYHIPLCLNPDQIWTLIIQGVSKHIELNAENLRHHFVDFEGKKELTVYRDGFVKGSPENDWPGCFAEWSDQIEGFIGAENRENFCPNFSTTGLNEKALHELSLMNTMKSYFTYGCMTCCGISKVKLLGKLSDWEDLLEKVRGLRQYDLDWWVDYLEPVIQNMVGSYQGDKNVSKLFWQCIYKHYNRGGSGSVPRACGWVNNFFPYVNESRSESLIDLEELYEKSLGKQYHSLRGIDYNQMPTGIAQTPFTWYYLGNQLKMMFHGGFIGSEIYEDEYLMPSLGWMIGDEVVENKSERRGRGRRGRGY